MPPGCYDLPMGTRKFRESWLLLRRGPKGLIARRLVGRVWGRRLFYDLRCELAQLPVVRPARVPVRMCPANRPQLEAALRTERDVATGVSYLQVLYLKRFLEAGVSQPYLAVTADGAPIDCQWLIRPSAHGSWQAAMPGRYRATAPAEVLLEGAYTFVAFRGLGAMADGMSQLLATARREGSPRRRPTSPLITLPRYEGVTTRGFSCFTRVRRLTNSADAESRSSEHPHPANPGTAPPHRAMTRFLGRWLDYSGHTQPCLPILRSPGRYRSPTRLATRPPNHVRRPTAKNVAPPPIATVVVQRGRPYSAVEGRCCCTPTPGRLS